MWPFRKKRPVIAPPSKVRFHEPPAGVELTTLDFPIDPDALDDIEAVREALYAVDEAMSLVVDIETVHEDERTILRVTGVFGERKAGRMRRECGD